MATDDERREIPCFPGYYADRNGNIWSRFKCNGGWRKKASGTMARGGHLKVTICQNGKMSHQLVHRLILFAFVGPCPEGCQCRHLNGNPKDNRLENLAWGTPHENQQDAFMHGVRGYGDKATKWKLTEAQAIDIIGRCQAGESNKEIAKLFGVDPSHIWSIRHGVTWKYLPRKPTETKP